MSIVSVAIIVSFHLKSKPSSVEERIALPVGLLFWVLSVACLVSGCATYVKTVTKYSRRQALVQSGWKTQVVSALSPSADQGAPNVPGCRNANAIHIDIYFRGLCHYSSLHTVPVYQCTFQTLVNRGILRWRVMIAFSTEFSLLSK